jgi:hypothetical protein
VMRPRTCIPPAATGYVLPSACIPPFRLLPPIGRTSIPLDAPSCMHPSSRYRLHPSLRMHPSVRPLPPIDTSIPLDASSRMHPPVFPYQACIPPSAISYWYIHLSGCVLAHASSRPLSLWMCTRACILPSSQRCPYYVRYLVYPYGRVLGNASFHCIIRISMFAVSSIPMDAYLGMHPSVFPALYVIPLDPHSGMHPPSSIAYL